MATVQKRGNTYKITVSCGYDVLGKQIRKTMTYVPEPNMTQRQIEKEVERQKVLFEQMCQSGSYINSNIKFADFIDVWEKDYAQIQLAPKTYERYKILLKRIIPELGHLKISKIQPHHLLSFYNLLSETRCRPSKCFANDVLINKMKSYSVAELSRNTKISQTTIRDIKDGKPTTEEKAKILCDKLNIKKSGYNVIDDNATLSERTILHYHRLLSGIFNIAIQWQVINDNPCARVKPPKVTQKEISFLDDIQAKELISLIDKAPIQYKTMIITLIYTGMRLGELCGLEWKDVDFGNEIITVRRSSQYISGRGIITKEPKNKSSIRTNKYPSVLFKLLKDYKVWQTRERLKLGDRWNDTDRLFTTYDGLPIHPNTLNTWLKKFLENTDLPHITVHSLRHTNATLLIAGGVDIRTVSKRLGHSQTSTTLNIYTHAIQSADAMAAQTIGDILNKNA